jgi:hypothetical protein
MIYEVVTLNVTVNGKKYLKGAKLDDSKFPKGLLKACYRDGAMKPQNSKAKNPLEVIAEYKKSESKAKAEAEKAAKKAEEEAKAEAEKAAKK